MFVLMKPERKRAEEIDPNQRQSVKDHVERQSPDRETATRLAILQMSDAVEEASRVEQLDRRVFEDDECGEGDGRQPQSARTRLQRHRHQTEEHGRHGDPVENPGRPPLIESRRPQDAMMEMVRIGRHHLSVRRHIAARDQAANQPSNDGQRRVEDRHAHRQERHADGHKKGIRHVRDERQRRNGETKEH